MQSEGSSYKVTILKNSEKPTGLHPLLSGIGNERVKNNSIVGIKCTLSLITLRLPLMDYY